MITTEQADLIKKLERALISSQDAVDASHDVTHCRRVLQNAKEIASGEGAANLTVLTAAAYLHDMVNVPKDADNRERASSLSALAARPILKSLGFGEEDIAAIQHCIEAHSFSANIKPETLEARILQDADRLESLGALGIARTFYIAGKMESDLFDGEDPFAAQRTLNDKQYAVDHFKIKLLNLVETMQTDAGKRIAQHRTNSMRQFLDSLAEELGTEQPW